MRRPETTNHTAPFRRRGPTSASGAMGTGDGRGAIRAATVRVPAPACRPRAKRHAVPASCAIYPMPRRLVSEESAELGERRLTARPESHLASDRLKYLTFCQPNRPKTVGFLNLSLACCASRCACPRFSARGSRIPQSVRSPRRACRYWNCDRRRQSNAGRGSRWRTSVCCSRAPNPRRLFHRR